MDKFLTDKNYTDNLSRVRVLTERRIKKIDKIKLELESEIN